VSGAIEGLEGKGWIECHRGGMRVATTYTLTYLPTHDGKPASHKWRDYRNPKLHREPKANSRTGLTAQKQSDRAAELAMNLQSGPPKNQKSDYESAVRPSTKSAVRLPKSDYGSAVRLAPKASTKSAAPIKKILTRVEDRGAGTGCGPAAGARCGSPAASPPQAPGGFLTPEETGRETAWAQPEQWVSWEPEPAPTVVPFVRERPRRHLPGADASLTPVPASAVGGLARG
jgi:hypothetical protein